MRLHPLKTAVVATALVSTATLVVVTPLSADDDTIIVRGCVRQSELSVPIAPSLLAWGRHGIMITSAAAIDSPGSRAPWWRAMPSVYWLDDDDGLAEHVGRDVEIIGDLGDFARGKIEIDQDDDITTIEMNLDGTKEMAEIPTRWLRGTGLEFEQEFEIVGRRLDVDDIRVMGACRQ
jgi:hypothetical protein